MGKNQRESALKTRRIETLLGENPVASTSQPNQNLAQASQSLTNPFFGSSQTKGPGHYSPTGAPRDAGTPIRESRGGPNFGGSFGNQ